MIFSVSKSSEIRPEGLFASRECEHGWVSHSMRMNVPKGQSALFEEERRVRRLNDIRIDSG